MIPPAQILEFAEKYQLAPYEVEIYCKSAIEQVVSEALRMDVRIDGDDFVTHDRKIKRSEISPQITRNMAHRINMVLSDARARLQFDTAIRVENTLVWGEAQYRPGQDHLIVRMDDQYVGYVNSKALPPAERGAWKLAGIRAWYVNHVSRDDRRTLVLSRSSVQLPALLTESLCASFGVDVSTKCIKRVFGAYNVIKSDKAIPDVVIKMVKSELKEDLKVVVSIGIEI